MSTEPSPNNDSTESATDQSGRVAGCPACGTALERGSHHGHPNWEAQCFVCPNCGVGSAAVAEVSGELAERTNGTILVRDTRWTTNDEVNEDVVADGGSQVQGIDGSRQMFSPSPFAVFDDDEPRTKRAKTEDMDVSLLKTPGRYEVHSASGNLYEVDVLEETCTCPDQANQCKHLRRVDIEISAKLVPRPDGRLP